MLIYFFVGFFISLFLVDNQDNILNKFRINLWRKILVIFYFIEFFYNNVFIAILKEFSIVFDNVEEKEAEKMEIL